MKPYVCSDDKIHFKVQFAKSLINTSLQKGAREYQSNPWAIVNL